MGHDITLLARLAQSLNAAALVLALLAGSAPAEASRTWDLGSWTAEYGAKGLFFESRDGRFRLHPQLRFQSRLYYPFDDDPTTVADFDDPPGLEYTLNRSRFKIGGHLGASWFQFYHELEFRDARVLDLRASIQRLEWLSVRVGQWKPEYNRERRDSSGTQQFVERSIINREFTIDRQPGAMLFGRLGSGRRFDTSWWAGVFTGAGRQTKNDGGRPMFMARAQWNPFGRVLPFSQSDLARRAKPAGSVALGFVSNRSRFTRFSSSGGGQLTAFAPGAVDQYRIRQALFETALHLRGFSWQQELHWKRIEDSVTGGVTHLVGGYAQAGYFFHELWDRVPEPLELALRVAAFDPDTSPGDDRHQEVSVAVNWFFNGHRNKLTLDGSWLRVDDPTGARSDLRVRLQWDLSL